MGQVISLNEMTTAEKLQALELLWDDLSRTPENIPTPAWHQEVLQERERAIEEGCAKFMPLEEFRKSIEKELP